MFTNSSRLQDLNANKIKICKNHHGEVLTEHSVAVCGNIYRKQSVGFLLLEYCQSTQEMINIKGDPWALLLAVPSKDTDIVAYHCIKQETNLSEWWA